MSNPVLLYGKSFANLLGGESSGDTFAVDYLSDTIKFALLDSGHTPNRNTHEVFSDVSGDEVSGAGYTTGGATLGSKTITYTAANSWAADWTTATVYAAGDIVKPTTPNGHVYVCVVGGTSDSGEPSFPTVSGDTVDDNTVTWAELGSGVTVIDAGDPSFTTATISDIRYGVGYKSGGGNPLLWLVDFADGPFSVSSGTFTWNISANGIYYFATP